MNARNEFNDFEITPDLEEHSIRFPTAQVEMIPISKLEIDPRYQRPLDVRRVHAIARDFNPKSFGAIFVSYREALDRYFMYDGQHRKEAVFSRTGDPDFKVPCFVVRNMTPEEEAEAFYTIATKRTKPHIHTRFKARLFAKEPHAVAIERVLTQEGYRPALGVTAKTAGTVTALDKIEWVYTRGGENALRMVLRIFKQAWPNDVDATRAYMLVGMYLFMRKYFDQIQMDRLIRKLSEVAAVSVQAQGRLIQTTNQTRPGVAHGQAILNRYNHGLPKDKRLPAWDTLPDYQRDATRITSLREYTWDEEEA